MVYSIYKVLTSTKTSLNKGETLFQCDGLISMNNKFLLYITDDGQLILYDYSLDIKQIDNTIKKSVCNAPAHLIYQNDGNIVLYSEFKDILWSWKTPSDGKIIIDPYKKRIIFVKSFMPEDTYNLKNKLSDYYIASVPLFRIFGF
jgi:hypothetical protein